MINPTEDDIGRVFVFSGDPDGSIGILTAVLSREHLDKCGFKGKLIQFKWLGDDTLGYANPDQLDWWSERKTAVGK